MTKCWKCGRTHSRFGAFICHVLPPWPEKKSAIRLQDDLRRQLELARKQAKQLQAAVDQLQEVGHWLRLLKGRFIEDRANRTITIDLFEIHKVSAQAYALMVKHFAGGTPEAEKVTP